VIAAALDMGANLIVLDTLARTFGEGDESATREMSAFVASADRLREETGAHVAVIHHGPCSRDRPRGSIALDAAADLIVKVAKDAEGGTQHLATVEAAKVDADGAEMPFRLRVVDLGGEDGREPRRTCVAEEAAAARMQRLSLPPLARKALRFLTDLIAVEGKPLPTGALFPIGLQGGREDRWLEECRTGAARPPRRRRSHRAGRRLCHPRP
jgi:hypothetical protein